MLLLITNALIETLTKHMFNNYLDEQDKITIGGAPSWYMMPVEDKMCTFAHKKGGLDYIDVVKKDARFKMIKKIDDTIEIVVYDNVKNIKTTKEKEVVEIFKHDPNLPIFVKKHIRYNRVSFEDEIDTTFVRACIPKTTIIEYQKDRLKDIKKEVLKVKSNSAFEDMELEQTKTKGYKDPNDPFSELP